MPAVFLLLLCHFLLLASRFFSLSYFYFWIKIIQILILFKIVRNSTVVMWFFQFILSGVCSASFIFCLICNVSSPFRTTVTFILCWKRPNRELELLYIFYSPTDPWGSVFYFSYPSLFSFSSIWIISLFPFEDSFFCLQWFFPLSYHSAVGWGFLLLFANNFFRMVFCCFFWFLFCFVFSFRGKV